MKRRRREPPEECSQCGEAIPRSALACPGCGADERTGWDSNPYLPGEEVLPEDEWEDDRRPPIFEGESWTAKRWLIVAAVIALALIYMAFQGR